MSTQAFLDAVQDQAQASDPRMSVWVSANAGTGKTHVLTQRVIRLLLTGTRPERILCLTFTKAAASEMARRLFQDLGTWSTLPDEDLLEAVFERTKERLARADLPVARRLFAQALETPGGLKIQTIHAFCERLLGRFPLEAKVAPNFNVLDERSAHELLDAARDTLFDEALAGENDKLAAAHALMVSRLSETGFEKLFREVIQKRNRLKWFLQQYGDVDGALAIVRQRMDLGVDENVSSLAHTATRAPSCDAESVRHAMEVLATSSKRDQGQSVLLSEFLACDDSSAALEIYADVFLKKDGDPKSVNYLITKKCGDAHPEIRDFLLAEQERIVCVQEKIKSARILEQSHALFTLAERFIQLYTEEKRYRAALDYDDLIVSTRELLNRSAAAAWVLYKLDGGLDHILVDEAQDTSPEQWNVIDALSQEFFSGYGAQQDRYPDKVRTIFAVGDEKQSIYSFQGADPKKFHEMSETFYQKVADAGHAWTRVSFQLSFRSTSDVLKAVDAFFADEVDQKHLTASGEPIAHVTQRDGQAGLVELWPIEKPTEQEAADPWDAPLDWESSHSPRAELAKRIAKTIQHWMTNQEKLASLDRPIEAGDVMILVRRRNEFVDHMIRELKQLRIPVAGADRMHLTEQLAVMDLIALTEFALQPDDDLSLACVLKSPLVGLTEEALFDLAHDRQGTLWQALASKKSDSVYAQAFALMSHVRARADFTAPFEFYQELLDGAPITDDLSAHTGRQKLLARLGRDANDPLDEFLNLALSFEQNNTPSLQGFLHWLSSGEAELKREQDQGVGQVRVMTVHGSKGLDSNIVFLPDTCQVPSANLDDHILSDDDVMLWRPGDMASHDPYAKDLRDAAGVRRDAEYHRLLYVAATRARDRLYIAGYQTAREPKEHSWYKRIERALTPLAEEVTSWDGQPILRIESKQSAAPDKRFPSGARDQVKVETPSWVLQAPPLEAPLQQPLAPSRLPLAQDGDTEPPALSPLVKDGRDRFLRGHLIHKLLEVLPNVPSKTWQSAAERYLERHATDVEKRERQDIISETLTILHDPDFSPLFAPGSQAEVALAGRAHGLGGEAMEEVTVSGFVDRLCVTDSDVMIVDYKTNRPPPEEVEGVPKVYLRQMAVYRALLREIYPNHHVRCALLWTDGPRWMPLPDPLMDRSLAGEVGLTRG